jgi:hypothetical protein
MENPSRVAYSSTYTADLSPVQGLAKLGGKLLCAFGWGPPSEVASEIPMHNFFGGCLVMENPSNDAYPSGCTAFLPPVKVLAKLGGKILCAAVWGLPSEISFEISPQYFS